MPKSITVRLLNDVEYSSLSKLYFVIENILKKAGHRCLAKCNFNIHIKKYIVPKLSSVDCLYLNLYFNDLVNLARSDKQDETGSYYILKFSNLVYVGITTLFVHERIKKHLYDSKKQGRKCKFHQAIRSQFGKEVNLESFLNGVDEFTFENNIPCNALLTKEADLVEYYNQKKGVEVLNTAKTGSLYGCIGIVVAKGEYLASYMRKKVKSLGLRDYEAMKAFEALKQRYYARLRKKSKDISGEEKLALIEQLIEERRLLGRFVPEDTDTFVFDAVRQNIRTIAEKLNMSKAALKSYLVRRRIWSSSCIDLKSIFEHPDNFSVDRVKHNFFEVFECILQRKGFENIVVKKLSIYQSSTVNPTIAGFLRFQGYPSKRSSAYYHLKKTDVYEASNALYQFLFKLMKD